MANEPEVPPEGGAGEQGGEPVEVPQAKPWWEARGFKSESEALTDWDNKSQALTTSQQEAAAMRKTLSAITAAPPRTDTPEPKKAPGYRAYFEGVNLEEAYADPYKFAETLMAAAERRGREVAMETYAGQESARELRENFFAEHKDLQKFPDLVKFYAQEIAAENPNMTVKEAYSEVAKRTRSKIAAIKGGEGAPAPGTGGQPPKEPLPHTGGGGDGGSGHDAPKPAADKPSAVDDVASEINRRSALKAQKAILR